MVGFYSRAVHGPSDLFGEPGRHAGLSGFGRLADTTRSAGHWLRCCSYTPIIAGNARPACIQRHTFHMLRRHQAIPLLQAAQASPTLAQLSRLTSDSSARLKAIEPLIPPGMRASIQAGPIEGSTWCLLVKGNAAASKLRQLLPSFEAHLRSKGWDVQFIRIKIQARTAG